MQWGPGWLNCELSALTSALLGESPALHFLPTGVCRGEKAAPDCMRIPRNALMEIALDSLFTGFNECYPGADSLMYLVLFLQVPLPQLEGSVASVTCTYRNVVIPLQK
jgi:hypothetical protein